MELFSYVIYNQKYNFKIFLYLLSESSTKMLNNIFYPKIPNIFIATIYNIFRELKIYNLELNNTLVGKLFLEMFSGPECF